MNQPFPQYTNLTGYTTEDVVKGLKTNKIKETLYKVNLQYILISVDQLDQLVTENPSGIQILFGDTESSYRIGYSNLSPNVVSVWLENNRRTDDKIVVVNKRNHVGNQRPVDMIDIDACIAGLNEIRIVSKVRIRGIKQYLHLNFQNQHFTFSRVDNIIKSIIPNAYVTSFSSFNGAVYRLNP